MKKNVKRMGMLCMLGVSALLLGGCAQGQGRMSYIGADAAKKQILAGLGLDESQVKIDHVDMATKNGLDYYQVEFSDDKGNTYRYDIDAMTGKVIESAADGTVVETTAEAAAETTVETTTAAETSALTAAAETTAETSALAAAAETAAETAAATGAAGTKTVANNQTTTAAAGAKLTAEEAKAKALAHAGLSASQVTVTKAKLEWDDGKQVYDVEFYGSDRTEYEYEVDAETGEVIQYSSETPKTQGNVSQSAGGSAGSNSILSEEAAKQLALAQVPGATAADITEFETDRDDGRIAYEGTICHGGMEYEFEIDAYSGAFRKWECEHDDDHHASHH